MKVFRGFAFVAAAAVLAVATASPLHGRAGSATGSVNVSATVPTNCTLGTGTMAFGNYDPLVANQSSNLDVTGSLSIACTKGTSATVSMDNGANSTHATGTTRAMATGTNYLSYELYTSSAHSTVWNATNTVSYTSSGKASSSLSIYGRVPSGQDASTGSYSDTVTATVSF